MGAATINAKRYLRIIICAPIMRDNKATRGISVGLAAEKATPLVPLLSSPVPFISMIRKITGQR